MKELNKLLYDILLKIEINEKNKFEINENLILSYFKELNHVSDEKLNDFKDYFVNFYNFCFELSLDNMIRDAINFKN